MIHLFQPPTLYANLVRVKGSLEVIDLRHIRIRSSHKDNYFIEYFSREGVWTSSERFTEDEANRLYSQILRNLRNYIIDTDNIAEISYPFLTILRSP